MSVIEVANPIGEGRIITSHDFGSPGLGATNAVMAALADDANLHVEVNGAHIWTAPNGIAVRLTATVAASVANDVKAVQVVIVGTDGADAPLTESLPAFTDNTPGSVTSVGSFKTVDSITVPAMDGSTAITNIGVLGAGASDVWANILQSIALTEAAGPAPTKVEKATITNPAVPRNLTATSADSNAADDIEAVQVTVYGTSVADLPISEALPAFTDDAATTVVGAKAFKTITKIVVPVQMGAGSTATVAIGTGAKLALPRRQARNTVLRAFLNGVIEATAPTVVADATNIESNTMALNSAMNGTPVHADYYDS